MSPSRSTLNVTILAMCQALAMTGNIMIIAMVALIGSSLAADKTFATLPLTLQFLGTMATVVPASLLMKRVGRRLGFMVGVGIGMLGAATAIQAIFISSFWLYCVGAALYGAFFAFSLFYRYAAADVASMRFRGKAISLVVGGGIFGAIFGPELAVWSRELFAPALFAGSYAVILALQASVLLLLLMVRIPPPSEEERRSDGRPLIHIMRQPTFLVAATSAMVGYGAMSLIMTATPLAITSHDHHFHDAAWVIQWHTVGMFAPSLVTGWLIARYGVLNVIAAGAVLTTACIAVNLAGVDLTYNFWTALILLGIGWNFMFVGGTTLLTECYRPAEKAKTQAMNDFLVFGTVALASLTSGAAYHNFGWAAVNYGVAPLIVVVFAANIWLRSRRVPAPA